MPGVKTPCSNRSPASLPASVVGAPLVPPPHPEHLHQLMRMRPWFLVDHLGLVSYFGGHSSELDLDGVETSINMN